jgi:hypothetical protein
MKHAPVHLDDALDLAIERVRPRRLQAAPREPDPELAIAEQALELIRELLRTFDAEEQPVLFMLDDLRNAADP